MMIASNFVQSIEGSSHTAGTTMAPSPLSAPPAIRSLGVRSAYSLEVTKAICLLSSWEDMSERGSQSFRVFSFQFHVFSFKFQVSDFSAPGGDAPMAQSFGFRICFEFRVSIFGFC